MTSDKAIRAFNLIAGIDTCRTVDENFWQQVVTRIVYDLDEAGATEQLSAVGSLLADMWEKCEPREGELKTRADFIARAQKELATTQRRMLALQREATALGKIVGGLSALEALDAAGDAS
jgi:hypothetical protein